MMFRELENKSITPENLQRRIIYLDEQDNDYFVSGMESAIDSLETAGIKLPPMDLSKYAKPQREINEVSSG